MTTLEAVDSPESCSAMCSVYGGSAWEHSGTQCQISKSKSDIDFVAKPGASSGLRCPGAEAATFAAGDFTAIMNAADNATSTTMQNAAAAAAPTEVVRGEPSQLNQGQCKNGDDWGISGDNRGPVSSALGCQQIILQEASCNDKFFIWAPVGNRMGVCYCMRNDIADAGWCGGNFIGSGGPATYNVGTALDVFTKSSDKDGYWDVQNPKGILINECSHNIGDGYTYETCAKACLDFGENCGGWELYVQNNKNSCTFFPKASEAALTAAGCRWVTNPECKYYLRTAGVAR